jgi:hypothetical protein
MAIAGLKKIPLFDGGAYAEEHLMELRELLGFSMLLRNVRQILSVRPNASKESFDRILRLRKVLKQDSQPSLVRGEGFVMFH